MIHKTYMFKHTFLTDSEQIQNFWEIILDQNVCVPKFLLDLGYDLTKHSCLKHIPDSFKTASIFFENLFESKYFKHSCSKHIPDRFKTD